MQNTLKDRISSIVSQSKGPIKINWVLLDSQSTINLFCNGLLLANTRKVETKLNIFCNAGKRSTNMVGDLKIYNTVWYYADGIANILSLHCVVH